MNKIVGYIKQIDSTLILEDISEHFTLSDFQNKIIPFALHYKFLLSPSPHSLSLILNEEEERQFKSFLLSFCN